ncbi:ATP-binding protein [Gordonia sp. N1V]|uniref:ATP-binding protein n=1 Tax=Gordonia sp. N1V TaxID=3034163 RepID=UPI0023E0E9D5|nr:ATP-binding protein [Gordonia sp. N1V]MDF3285520.1 ATP-binding protein [Gordonia sp. N1V]
MTPTYPFTAVLGHDEFKTALLLTAVDPGISGVLATGDRGTAKSTLIRALGELLAISGIDAPVVDLPLGATEDRVVGALDVDRALRHGEAVFRPGLLADAHGGYLYIDEVNLLDDFVVDLLLDVAASGINIVERDGLSHRHPARFVLVGSGNPEEGQLRPQLEDRFGLSTHVQTITDVGLRTQIVRQRLDYDSDPDVFAERFSVRQHHLAQRLAAARADLEGVEVDEQILSDAVRLCVEVDAVGHRGEVMLIRAARALAALRRHPTVTRGDLADAAIPVLRHRIPREPFERPTVATARVRNAVVSVVGHFAA